MKQDVSQRTASLAAARCRLRRAHREAVTLLGKAHSLPRRLQKQLESVMVQKKLGGQIWWFCVQEKVGTKWETKTIPTSIDMLCFVWLVYFMRYVNLTVECQMVLWLVVHECLGS